MCLSLKPSSPPHYPPQERDELAATLKDLEVALEARERELAAASASQADERASLKEQLKKASLELAETRGQLEIQVSG